MRNSREILDEQFFEMRWRTLSLAADLDRIDRAGALDDQRLQKLREAFEILLRKDSNRAEQVQMLLSDTTPPPSR